MYRHSHDARGVLRALIPTFLLVAGCAPCSELIEPTIAPGSIGPVVAHGVGDGRYVALEAVPSPTAAELLPANAHYRAVLGVDGQLALVIVAPDQRILGRLHVADDERHRSTVGTRVDYEDLSGRTTRVEAWSFAGSIDGQALIGKRSARFRVRLEPDGSLAGERWSLAHGDAATAELDELRRARAIGADLGDLAAQLSSSGAFADHDRCALVERLALAELALELSVRAWDGEERSRLPVVSAFVRDFRVCGL